VQTLIHRKYLLISLIINIILIAAIIWGILTLVPLSAQRVGSIATDFALQSIDNKTIRLTELQGKTVLLYFWVNTSACRENLLQLQSMYDKLPKDKFEIVAILLNEQVTNPILSFRDRFNITFPIAIDENNIAFKELRIPNIAPYSFIISRGGSICVAKVGAFANENEIDTMIKGVTFWYDK
jgi:peroxiredoxin